MAISGGIKFFLDNVALQTAGGSVVASSGTVIENNIIDNIPYTYWTSVGSNDSTTETLTVTFASATVSRLLLLDHNWKQYTAKYWNGSSFVDFAGVLGLDPTGANGNGISMGSIAETVFADTASYYEFTPVTTTQIQLTVTKTQTASAQKFLGSLLLTSEIATLQGYPTVDPVAQLRNARTMQMLSGRVKIVKQPEIWNVTLTFANYPILQYGADIDAILTIIDSELPIYIWLCGGRRGSNYFSYALRGWRLIDCFRVQTDSDFSATFTNNIYKHGIATGDILFQEHV